MTAKCDDPRLADGLSHVLQLFLALEAQPDSWQLTLTPADGLETDEQVPERAPAQGVEVLVDCAAGRATLDRAGRSIEVRIAPDLPGWAVMLVPILRVLQSREVLVMHSACFADRLGRGFLFPGNHASGKTTLTLTALRLGCKIVTDDILLARREGQDLSFLPLLSVLSLEEGRPTKTMFNVLGHYHDNVFQPVINPRFILFPRITERDKTTIEPIRTRKEILDLMLTNSLLADGKSAQAEQLRILWQLAGKASAYRLFLGRDHRDSPEIAHEILEHMEVEEVCCSR